jgi:hypothetical protein
MKTSIYITYLFLIFPIFSSAQQLPGGGPSIPGESGFYMSDNVNDKARTTFDIPSGSFTLELSYRLCNSNITTVDRIVDAQGSTAGSGFHIQAQNSGFNINTKGSSGSVQINNLSYTHDTDWHYLAFVHNAEDSINQLWIDGVGVDTFHAPITPASFIVFGGTDNNFGGSFNGLIDEIVISDTNLYSEYLLFSSVYPNITEHTVAKWSFEDGQDAMVFVDSIAGHVLNGQAGAHSIALPEGILADTLQRPLNESVQIQANGGADCSWTPATGLSSTTGSLVEASPLTDTWYYVTITDSAECAPVLSDSVFVQVVDPAFGTVEHDMSGVYYGDGDEDRAKIDEFVIPDESDFTIEMLFKFCDANGTRMLFDSRGSTAGTGVDVRIENSSSIRVTMEGFSNEETQELIELGADLSAGQWHHVAVTHSNTDSVNAVFFDGVEVNSFVNGFVPASKVVVGGYDHNYQGSYQGQIDNVRISNTIRYSGFIDLSALEISNDANTVALWNFEDGQNSTIMADVSGNGYDMAGEGGSHVNAPFGSSQYAEYFGIPVQIEAYGGSICSWTPTDGLDDATVFNPMASPMESGYYYVSVTDTNACYTYQDSVYIEVDLTTVGIGGYSNSEVVVYPNPVNGNQGFSINGLDNCCTYNAQLFDIAGHLIQEQSLAGDHWFKTAGIANGVYILALQRNDSMQRDTVEKVRVIVQD